MISSQKNDLLRESHFQGKQEANYLTTLHTSINIIPEEEVPRVLTNNKIVLLRFIFVAHFFEHVEQVCVLAMNVTEYLNGCLELY